MSSASATRLTLPWGQILLVAVGVATVLLGARGFYRRGHFGWNDALSCALLLVPAAMLLLLGAYVLQHARLAAAVPVFLAAVLVFAYAPFAIALGLSLLGIVVGPAWQNRRAAPIDVGRP